ncbi:putative nucleic acid-binding protein [Helianthus annuus]|uniref:Nucleic acid-binding protein n=2 Tax=Helianthus annuus TaxID=4232 RepID=A0A251UYM2_HELAN|nr:uncharacterized protein LOC110936812 isoform X1 [Helianthus annuus]KAF5809488.1 putative nucleic acid-binding protein [Helianthus annuus]KAJ0588057.1 putative nucleic acid-binding protein [Helianthus annuus]
MAAIGWYGPLINLSEAPSHIGHFVQLLVLVHRTLPVEYKSSGGGRVIRTDVQVGDDTRPYFGVSIWNNKHMESVLKAGNVVLLQNVKVTRFGDAVEARTVQQSSIKCLIDSYESIRSEGVNNLMKVQHIGIASKEKLKKVITWVLRVEPILFKRISHNFKRNQNSANWKFPEEMQHKDCLSLVEVSNLNDSCNASFFASVGEMFLPMHLPDIDEERMFIRSRICSSAYGNLAEDLVCTGCQLCGAPLNSEFGSRIEQKTVPLYCQKSLNRLHVVGLIYRPFLLYVWDDSTYIPLVIKNKAAEILFGNIKAESVHSSYRKQARGQLINKGAEAQCGRGLNFYTLWLVLLKSLLQPGKNSPLKFEVCVDTTKSWENGRFEMVSLSLPLVFQDVN